MTKDIDPGQEALIRITAHEKQCVERMEEIRRGLGTLSTRLWWILGAALTGLGLVAFEFIKKT